MAYLGQALHFHELSVSRITFVTYPSGIWPFPGSPRLLTVGHNDNFLTLFFFLYFFHLIIFKEAPNLT